MQIDEDFKLNPNFYSLCQIKHWNIDYNRAKNSIQCFEQSLDFRLGAGFKV